jgi:hypothetical protein
LCDVHAVGQFDLGEALLLAHFAQSVSPDLGIQAGAMFGDPTLVQGPAGAWRTDR